MKRSIYLKRKRSSLFLGTTTRHFMTGATSDLHSYASAAMEWTRNAASQDSFNYILGLKDIVTIDAKGERTLMFHESPKNFQDYIFPDEATPDLLSNINGDALVLKLNRNQPIKFSDSS